MTENKWVTGVITPINGVISQLITSRGPPCRHLAIPTASRRFRRFLEYDSSMVQTPHQMFRCLELLSKKKKKKKLPETDITPEFIIRGLEAGIHGNFFLRWLVFRGKLLVFLKSCKLLRSYISKLLKRKKNHSL